MSEELQPEVSRKEIAYEIDRYIEDCGDVITEEEVNIVKEVRHMLVEGLYAEDDDA